MVLTNACLCAHTHTCKRSVVLIDGQKLYIEEVDVAGDAVIALHRMIIDAKWVGKIGIGT